MPGRRIKQRDLEAAQTSQSLVRLSRRIPKAGKLDGYVVASSSRWLLLALHDPNMFLNGWTAVRLDDLTRMEDGGGPESFPAKALRLTGDWPPRPPAQDIDP